jgi:hypothetical protein
MWMTILSFIGGAVIKGLIDAYQAKLKAGNVTEQCRSPLPVSFRQHGPATPDTFAVSAC